MKKAKQKTIALKKFREILTEKKPKQIKKIKWQAFERETPFTLAFKCLSRSLSPHRLPENDSLGYGDRVGFENFADPGFFSAGAEGVQFMHSSFHAVTRWFLLH